MIVGGVAEVFFGIEAEGKSLESIASPLTAADSGGGRLSEQTAPSAAEPRA